MENTIFNWNKIYSQENAKILEELLDRETASFIEFMEIFFTDHVAKPDIYSYLVKLIQPGAIRDLNNQIQQNLLSFLTQDYFFLCFVQRWLEWCMCLILNVGELQPEVHVARFLFLLIDTGALPVDIRRLPRLVKKDVISTYYEDILNYNSATVEEIISHSANYSNSEPITLTYFEAVRRIKKSGFPESLLKNDAMKSTHCFLKVNPDDAYTEQVNNIFNLEHFREANSGTPSYKTRYKELERLKQETIEQLFNGKTIRIKAIRLEDLNLQNKHETKIRAKDSKGNPIFGTYTTKSLEVQSTDIETKFHLKRRIASCIQRTPDGTTKQSYEFQLKDSCYLQDYIEALIISASQNAQTTKTTDEESCNSIVLSVDEIIELRQNIPNETTKMRDERITKLANKYEDELKNKFKRKLPRKRIIARIHSLLTPIYEEFNLKLPIASSCETVDRTQKKAKE